MLKTAPIKTEILGEDHLSKKLQTAQKRAMSFAQGISKVGDGLTKYVSVPLAAAGIASVKFAIDLNKSMANVATLMPKSSGRVNQLKSEIQDLSISSGKSTEDLSTGLYDVVSAFGDTADTMDRLKIASTASVAGMSTTQEAISLLSAVTKGYGDTSVEAMQKVSDLSFQTVKLGQTTFPELASAMGKVVPVAASLNVSQQELFAGFATLTGVTGTASEVSTQLRSVLKSMLKPGEDVTKAVKSMGFASASAMVKQIGLRESLIRLGAASGGPEKLQKAVKKLGFANYDAMVNAVGHEEAARRLGSQLQKSDSVLAKMFPDMEGLVAALALLGGQSGNFEDKLRSMNSTLGATSEAYAEADSGINKTGRSFEKLKARAVVFAQRVGDKLLPILERLFTKIDPLLTKLEKMDDATLEWGLKLAGVALAAGPTLSVVGRLTTGLLKLTQIGSQAGAFAGISSGLGGIGASANTAMGKVSGLSKALGLLGKVGLVGEAAAIGVAAGTALHEAVIKPGEEKKYSEEEAIVQRRIAAEKMLVEGTSTPGQRLSMAKQLQQDMAGGLREAMTTFGGDLSYIIAPLMGEETVGDRFQREYKKLKETHDKLMASSGVEEMKKVLEPKAKPEKQQVDIKFSADVPGSVKVTGPTGPLGSQSGGLGAIMGGL